MAAEAGVGAAVHAPEGTRAVPRRARIDSGRAGVHRGWVLMVVAGVLAAAANLAALGASTPGVSVVVVDGTHPAGTPVTGLSTRVVSLQIDDAAALRLLTPERLTTDLAGAVTVARLDDGEMLRVGDLRPATIQTLSAMSLPLDVGRGVGGSLEPGDVVDVIAASAAPGGGDPRAAVQVVGRQMEVLDVLRDEGSGLVGGNGYVVTLAVDDDQALALAAALRAGDIDVIRRPPGGQGDG